VRTAGALRRQLVIGDRVRVDGVLICPELSGRNQSRPLLICDVSVLVPAL
jgi:hypothetical protein